MKKPARNQMVFQFEEIEPEDISIPRANLFGPDGSPRLTRSSTEANQLYNRVRTKNGRLAELALREINGWASGFYS